MRNFDSDSKMISIKQSCDNKMTTGIMIHRNSWII